MARIKKEPLKRLSMLIPKVIHDQLQIVAHDTDDTVTGIVLRAIKAQVKPLGQIK